MFNRCGVVKGCPRAPRATGHASAVATSPAPATILTPLPPIASALTRAGGAHGMHREASHPEQAQEGGRPGLLDAHLDLPVVGADTHGQDPADEADLPEIGEGVVSCQGGVQGRDPQVLRDRWVEPGGPGPGGRPRGVGELGAAVHRHPEVDHEAECPEDDHREHEEQRRDLAGLATEACPHPAAPATDAFGATGSTSRALTTTVVGSRPRLGTPRRWTW